MATDPEFRLENRSALATTGRYGAAVTQLLLLGASGLTRLVASAHATIAQRPGLLDGKAASADEAPAAYEAVSKQLRELAKLAGEVQDRLGGQAEAGLFRSALNGVLGDSLASHDNALLETMSLRDENGRLLGMDDWQRDARRGLVLFVHGLCLSEREWQSHAHSGFVRELREFGYGVAWLRYNTGRAIHENGTQLSELLAGAETAERPLTLIGHSMGGLVIRAACHAADENGHGWRRQLRHAAYLGTPHQGAPLERWGENANRLLALTPYTQPFMQIGNLRSRSIQDLHDGRIAAEGRPLQLAAGVRHLLVAGQLSREKKMHVLGDGLVPVRSALGQHLEIGKALQGEDVTRCELEDLGHMELLSDSRVYARLLDWLQP